MYMLHSKSTFTCALYAPPFLIFCFQNWSMLFSWNKFSYR